LLQFDRSQPNGDGCDDDDDGDDNDDGARAVTASAAAAARLGGLENSGFTGGLDVLRTE
jgi:hypothetical protein